MFPVLVFCQQTKLVASKLSSEFVDADLFIGNDSFDCKYFIKNNVFFKIKSGEIFQYKNISLGKISRIDFQNPLKIVLFYENFNTVILLDNQLNEIQKINFSENEKNIAVTAVGISAQNNLWVFNLTNQQIGLYDYLKNKHKDVSSPISGMIKQYQTNFNTFYWIDERNYYYSCDVFGKTIALGKLPAFDSIQLVSNLFVVFKKNDLLYYYSINSDKPTVIDLDKKTYKNFYYKDQNLAIFTSEGITNYKINLP